MKMILRSLVFLALPVHCVADPQLTSWYTLHSGEPARIYRSDAARLAGESLTTWSNGRLSQSRPVNAGVQEISYSKNWIYIRSSGMASQIMGPWYGNAEHSRPFPNLPKDQHILMALPRHPVLETEAEYDHLGDIGITADGVPIFDATDAFSYSHQYGMDADPRAGIGQGDGVWDRDAMPNEAQTFDPAMGHQENWGRYHYHAEAIALRYELGDHVDFDNATKTYRESAGEPAKHSPIIGWLKDGYPVYGPYGYANPTNPASGLRRMVSGYVARNGENGADNLALTGRHTLPAWQSRKSGANAELRPDEYGPEISQRYPLGHYIQDYAYRGDLGQTLGRDFDLDEHNGRWCVTPEYPHGTYAYFTTIDAQGRPVFPYMMGMSYHGQPVGQAVRRIAEPVTVYFASATNTVGGGGAAAGATKTTLTWHPENGGDYAAQPGNQ